MTDPTTTPGSPTPTPSQPGYGWGPGNPVCGRPNPATDEYLRDAIEGRVFIRLGTDKGPIYMDIVNIGGWGPDDSDPNRSEITYKDGVLVIARGIIETPDEIARLIAEVGQEYEDSYAERRKKYAV